MWVQLVLLSLLVYLSLLALFGPLFLLLLHLIDQGNVKFVNLPGFCLFLLRRCRWKLRYGTFVESITDSEELILVDMSERLPILLQFKKHRVNIFIPVLPGELSDDLDDILRR